MTKHERTENSINRPSQLFLLRIWIDEKYDGRTTADLAGKVQDPVSGQVQYFRGGMKLVRILLRLIAKEVGRPIKHPDDNQL